MRRLIGFLVVVALLLVVADRVAWWVAQRGLATAIQNSQHLSERPDVRVAGFPFFTQVLRGRYQQVDANIHNLSVPDGSGPDGSGPDGSAQDSLTISSLKVQLRGVRVTTGDLLSGRVTKAPVDSATAVATVDYPALDAAAKANIPDRRLAVHFKPGHGQLLAVTGDYTSPQIALKLDAEARVSTHDGDLQIGLLPSSLAALPAPIRAQVKSLLGGGYRLPPLPFGFEAKTVTVGPDGVTVRAAATSVVLTTQ